MNGVVDSSHPCDEVDLRADRMVAALLLVASFVVLGVVLLDRRERGRGGARASAIDLNSASLAEIELLPEIGPALAARIVESREKDGAFRSARDLDRVRGIGEGTIERVTPLVECVMPR
ncbi:MAG: helix-hairpin-helix domain-containing protein [Phycisphaerae bacterium]|nr:helix-hairpin-helix domain-containing protein [Phycisphaerae bacterium]